jgi:hypothetical protein
MKKVLFVIFVLALALGMRNVMWSMAAEAQQGPNPVQPRVMPTLLAADAKALAPLAVQYQALEARRVQLGADYKAFYDKFDPLEMQALLNAKADYRQYAIDPAVGTKIVPRQSVPQNR